MLISEKYFSARINGRIKFYLAKSEGELFETVVFQAGHHFRHF